MSGADPSLQAIGWPVDLPLPELAPGERLARVIEQHRSAFTLHDGQQRLRAQAPRGLVMDADQQPGRLAVGDWVAAIGDAEPLGMARSLPRRTVLRRAAAGERHKEQVLATNIDLAVIVMGLDGDYNPRRLERYLTLVGAAGIEGLVVLSKADRSAELAERFAETRALAGTTPVLAINCKDPRAVAPIGARLGPGRSGVLLGSSGAGKSTLSNALIGNAGQKTGEVRASDSRGRHTTTSRSLLSLPSGGCLIDSPGMRELKLIGDEPIEEDRFADIEALASHCRFSDCAHVAEPGCAINAAIEAGTLDGARFDHYLKLSGERDAAAGQRAAQQKKADDKASNRALNQRLIGKYGRR
jgi:ribosome biogenesis GTPase